MRIRRAMRKKPLRRPVKKPRLKRRRLMEQKKRLIELGVSEEKIKHMTSKDIRQALNN